MVFHEEIKPMLTVKDVARFLNIHTNTVRRWSDNDVLRAYRITPRGDRRFRKEDIDHFLGSYNEFNSSKARFSEMNLAGKAPGEP